MTGAQFSEVDFDLLADYVGGALAGTPDEGTVADLIAADPAWRAAFDELSAAMATVGTQLNALGAVPEPMPAELARRLDAAFSSAGSEPAVVDAEPAAPAASSAVTPGAGAASGRHLAAVPDDGVDRQSRQRPARAGRRRSLRWAAPTAAAAAVIAFLAVGINYLSGQSQSDKSASTAAGVDSGSARSTVDAPMMSKEQAAEGQAAPARILTSGQDYQRATLGSSAQWKRTWHDESAAPRANAAPGVPRAAAPLARLASGSALDACLAAITRENAAGRLSSVQAVDYARFEGRPALIVRFTAANGEWVWATGPDCGLPGVGAAQLAAVKVG